MAEAATQTLLRKHQCIPFLDVKQGATGAPDYKRIDKSTIFSLNPNPQTEKHDWISSELPEEVIDHYEPELPQEIALYEGNPVYDFVAKLFYDLPVGNEAKVPTLICFPGTSKRAWRIPDTTLVLGEYNTVDKKISFTLKFGGDIERGTYTVTEGVPTFTPATKS